MKGPIVFAEMLLKNKTLEELNLIEHSILEEGTQKLIDSLKHNTCNVATSVALELQIIHYP